MSVQITTKLQTIQSKLVAPKNQRNNFGNYNYRSCEDILIAVKPLLKETNTVLTIEDEIVLIGNRYYVKATAILFDCESEAFIKKSAYARESENKKGMDDSQITGATSSYARKYALNGLFCIDDTKDADATNGHVETKQEYAQPDPIETHNPSSGSIIECQECGKVVNENVKKYSLNKYKKILCFDCQKVGAK